MVLLAVGVLMGFSGCDKDWEFSNNVEEETNYQNQLMAQATDEVGMPENTELLETQYTRLMKCVKIVPCFLVTSLLMNLRYMRDQP